MMQHVARVPRAMSVARVLSLATLVSTGACFATRSDVRLVQTDIASLRTELLRNNVDQRAALSQAMKLLQVANDSMVVVSARVVSMQGDVRGETRAIKEQLLQIQQLLGQSQATIARLRAELAERANAPAPVTAPPVSVSTPPTTPVPIGAGRGGAPVPASATNPPDAGTPMREPGPSELYQNGRDQLTRGSTGTARMLFQQLLTNYPTYEDAPDAQFWIAESFARENNTAAADAAYAAVVVKYANAPKAPTALYKRAMLFVKQSNTPKARELFEQLVKAYPRSDEAEFAAAQLKTLR